MATAIFVLSFAVWVQALWAISHIKDVSGFREARMICGHVHTRFLFGWYFSLLVVDSL